MEGIARKVKWRAAAIFWFLTRSHVDIQIADKNLHFFTRSRDVPFWMYWDLRNQQVKQDAADLQLIHTIWSNRRRITFFDIGAYIGKYSLYTSSLDRNNSVHAFEPNPRNRRMLRENIKLNGSEKLITVHDCAISDRDGVVYFKPTGQKSHISESTDAVISVRSVKLDSFVNETGVIPDIVKIDCEGYEFEVFEGGKQTLTNPSTWIFLEFHNDILRQRGLFDRFCNQLFSLGRQFYNMESGGQASIDDFRRGGHYLVRGASEKHSKPSIPDSIT